MMIDKSHEKKLIVFGACRIKGEEGGAVRLTPPIAYLAILEEHDIEGET